MVPQVASGLFQVFEVVRAGIATNWWGLACPAHCHPSSLLTSLLLLLTGFGLGLFCGFALLLGLALRYFHLIPASSSAGPHLVPSPGASLALSRLSGYIHG